MPKGRERPPLWALVGTAVFVAILPGTVVGWIPYWLSHGWNVGPALLGIPAIRWLGAVLVIAGAVVFMDFVTRFVWEGHGTPAPVAPTNRLVVSGPFRWVRNPGYVAIITMLIGQGLVLGSRRILAYSVAMAAAFHVFVVWYEEPTLRRTFGDEFEAYRRMVPRWLPRLPAPPDTKEDGE